MRLVLEADERINLIRRYGEGEILIGAQRITAPCIVTPERLLLDWRVSSFAALEAVQLEPLLALGASIILLGSGLTQPTPSAQLRSVVRTRALALEYMNLGAACRTYNILASEQRAVVAGLFP